MTAALEGIRVLDLTMLYPGPLCTMILADLGAEVIKVEPPGTGDHARAFRFLFNQINRNKKSLCLNLKDPQAQEAFRTLARTADVVVEGFRPGTTARLGVDYETLRGVNPRIIYCSISGFGQDGPYRDRPGHDINYMGLGGVLGLTRDREGNPIVPGFEVADITSGLNSVIGIQAALLARERTGEGQFVDISMLDCVVALLHNSIGPYLETGEEPAGNLLHTLPHYGIFETLDGKGLALGIAHEDWFWNNLCEALGMDEQKGLNTVERAIHGKDLLPRVAEAIRRRPLDEWMRILTENDVPCAPLASVKEALDDPQVRYREMVVEIKTQDNSIKQLGSPYKLSETPVRFEMPPPRLGEHTDELLQEAGYDAAQIAEMRETGAVL
ncbi:MAG: CaiB/BaiF CoA-transferase family protein [Actinomycetota bacterium]|nr:CaiB/BaiF CoA-transferase family protein [Actinomycetota bacterium]MDD5666931.1 CaiB/BaiF CoA-transferase family protein [Actinomycetota bacterium]